MPTTTFATAVGREVRDQDGRLLAAFSNAWDAIRLAASINAGDARVEQRSVH